LGAEWVFDSEPKTIEGWRKIILETNLRWLIPPLDRVALRVIHYSENYELGSPAWKHLLPESGHVVHLEEEDGSGISTHTVALFHQLRCLEIIHDAYVDEGSHKRADSLASHCFNYLRQTTLCMCDMRNGPHGTLHTAAGYDFMCYDWEKLYEEGERNFQVYKKLEIN
jgi:hypothetical protein